jgi:hypothetical protein
MSLAACALMMALASGSVESTAVSAPASGPTPAVRPLTAASLPRLEPPPTVEAWMHDARPKRPGALPILYASLAGLQALDMYSTRRALGAGAREANPIVEPAAGSSGAMIAVKAASTAASIYFTERAWKKNRKGAIVLMAVVNGVTAAVAARNLHNARR